MKSSGIAICAATLVLFSLGLVEQAAAIETFDIANPMLRNSDSLVSTVAMHRGGGGVHRGGGAHVNRNMNVNRNVNRNVNVNVNRNRNVNVHANTYRGGVYRGGWGGRPYRWAPGGAIAAGAAIGFVGAATAVAWAPQPPQAGLCWYYTDPSQRNGFWDTCP